jgi:hypothetical protein
MRIESENVYEGLYKGYEELYRSMSQRLNDTTRRYLQLQNDYIGLRGKQRKPLNTNTGLRFFLDEISKN